LNNGISGQGQYAYISELGVTTNADTGKLQLDSDQLMSALQENSDSVIGFFSDQSVGFATRMDNILEGFLQAGGTLGSIVNNANSRVDSIERSRESLERRLETIEQRYLKQFSALDTLMTSMTTTSDYLTSQLDMLSNMINRNDK
jgi:flagellar hook-associated protein 2